MKKLAIMCFLALFNTVALAQLGPDFKEVQKRIYCGPAKIVLEALADEDINEKPTWIGRDERGTSDYVLFSNPKTKSWTLVQMGKDWACIIAIGTSSQFLGTRNLINL